MAARHIPKAVLGVVVLTAMCCGQARGQGSPTTNEATPSGGQSAGALPKKDTLEETVFAEMLRIVDEKFDSLSARISVLERSVSSLNFYSIRQFREITETIEESTAATEGLRNQVTKMDVENRALKIAVSTVGRDVSKMKVDSVRMFDDIANSIVYFNQNVEEKAAEIKTLVETTTQTAVAATKTAVAAAAEAASADIGEDTAILIKYLEDMPRHVNCNVNFGPLEERIDLRFAEMKRQTHNNFVDLINAEKMREESEESEDQDQYEGEAGTRPYGPRLEEEVEEERRKEAEMVMRMLANMTHNVMEATAYFRHTGAMIETLLARTDSIAEEQTKLRFDVLEAGGLLTPGEGGEELFEELVNNLPGVASQEDLEDSNTLDVSTEADDTAKVTTGSSVTSDRAPANESHPEKTPRRKLASAEASSRGVNAFSALAASRRKAAMTSSPEKGAYLPVESINVLAELAKNGTQLLDVLTDLAQLTSSSLTQAVGSLHDEVVRLEDLRTRINAGLFLAGGKTAGGTMGQAEGGELVAGGIGGAAQELKSLQNTTKTIFTIVEAIASNTGWIPYIFHNMQHVERLANRTLELARQSLQQLQWSRPMGNEVPGVPEAQERRQRADGEGDQLAAMTQAEALDVIYETNLRLKRIMPALTRLLAEPEPLIALVDGKRSTEGRVEVFFKGQWRSVCQGDMGHAEASTICRHLGHNGGISAGAGHFGQGTGQRWGLNMTCLPSLRCPFVTSLEGSVTCPNGDLAVICDHMLRMLPISDVNDVNTGRIEMHDQGLWLPVCAYGWSGYEARVACKQMGYRDGREFESPDASANFNSTVWVTGVSCDGEETRLDACKVESYSAAECPAGGKPAAVRCQ